MLDQLRKHARGWGIKFFLGIMAVGLIFYFGYTRSQKTAQLTGKHKSAAIVNGKPISLNKYRRLYDVRVNSYRQFYKQYKPDQPVPESTLQDLRNNILDELIREELFTQQATQLGLTVSDEELAQEIISIHTKEGRFNKNEYLQNLNAQKKSEGEDYEAELRKSLLAQKFEDFIRKSVSVSDPEVEQEYRATHLQINLQKITLDSTQWTENADQKLKDAESEILTAFAPLLPETQKAEKTKKTKTPPKNQALEDVKKKYALKTEETGLHSFREKAIFTGT